MNVNNQTRKASPVSSTSAGSYPQYMTIATNSRKQTCKSACDSSSHAWDARWAPSCVAAKQEGQQRLLRPPCRCCAYTPLRPPKRLLSLKTLR